MNYVAVKNEKGAFLFWFYGVEEDEIFMSACLQSVHTPDWQSYPHFIRAVISSCRLKGSEPVLVKSSMREGAEL